MVKLYKASTGIAGAALMALFLSGCATGPRTYSNESPLADFANYATYNFAETLGTDEPDGVRSLLSQYLIAEISNQLDARGYSYAEEGADMTLNFELVTKEKIRGTPSTTLGGYYGYGPYYPGYGYYGGYGGGTTITQYTEGALSVTIIDSETRSVAWEGVSVSQLTDDVLDNLEVSVKTAVNEMFLRFPYRAGAQPAAVAKLQQDAR